MATRLFVPRDAAARAVGADKVAAAILDECKRKGLSVEIVRTGSRGLFWLEPLIVLIVLNDRMPLVSVV